MAQRSKETRDRYCKLFNELDKDGNGWLSREEVGAWLKGAGYKLSEQQIERIFRLFDKDANGRITLDEFYLAMDFIEKPEINPADLRKVFRAMDINGDGQLSEEELFEGLNKCGYNMGREAVQRFVTRNDINNDGQISFEEFLAAFQRTSL